jgi:tripartite-type tricarboxylate transporter receptor subunit TctC
VQVWGSLVVELPAGHCDIDIIDTLDREVNAILADPRMKARLADLGSTVLAGSPSDFGSLIADETEKWGKVIRAANIKAE